MLYPNRPDCNKLSEAIRPGGINFPVLRNLFPMTASKANDVPKPT